VTIPSVCLYTQKDVCLAYLGMNASQSVCLYTQGVCRYTKPVRVYAQEKACVCHMYQ